MGLGPWAQAEQNKMLVKAERARLRRIVARELAAVFANPRVLLPDNEVIEMLDRIKAKIGGARKRRLTSAEIAKIGGGKVNLLDAVAAPPRKMQIP